MNEYLRLLNEFKKSPTLCNFLQLLAYDTWQRLEFARTRNGFKVYETTITQNILYEICIYCDLYPKIPIRMFEAVDEPHNGNDIELIIKTKDGYIIAPLQAKIIYSTNNYPKMEHGNQINDLIKYAKSVGGFPLYLLYNFYSDNILKNKSNLCDITFTNEQYGCSLISAYYLLNNFAFKRRDRNGNLKWNIPSFTDLHPSVAVPWFVLGCCRNEEYDLFDTINLINQSTEIGEGLKQEIIAYKFNDLIKKDSWKKLDIRGLNYSNDFIEIENTKFIPKYRIVIDFDERKEKL